MERKTGFEPATLTLARCLSSSAVSWQVLRPGLPPTEGPPNPPEFHPVVERSTTRSTHRDVSILTGGALAIAPVQLIGPPEARSVKLAGMVQTISGTHLLDPEVIAQPYGFYEELRATAPVWEVPGTGIFTVATYQILAEAAARVEDFSSNLNCLLYRDARGMPCRFSFGDAGVQALATADPPMHALHRGTVFPELVAKRMAALEPDVVEIAEDCVGQALKSKGSVDFMLAVGNVVPITMISRLVGFRNSDLDQ